MAEDKVEPASDEAVEELNRRFNEEQERLTDEYTGKDTPGQTAIEQQRDEAILQARAGGLSDEAIAQVAQRTITEGGNMTSFIARLSQDADLTTDRAAERRDNAILSAFANGDPIDRKEWEAALIRQGGQLPSGYKRSK